METYIRRREHIRVLGFMHNDHLQTPCIAHLLHVVSGVDAGAERRYHSTTASTTSPSSWLAASKPRVGSRLAPIQLVHRSPTYVDNVPGLLLIALEEEQLCKQRENTLIMKFSSGIPRLQEIRDNIASEWQLENNPAVGYLDPRDVTLHMASVADSNRALARTTNKINNSLFRFFRWTPEFKIG